MKKLRILLSAVLFWATSLTAFADFTDVQSTELYFKGIQYLQENGVINGYEDGTFRPKIEVNRAEMIKILIEAKGVPAEELEPYSNASCFQDVPAGVWYTKYVCYAKDKGWVNGYDGGKFFKPGESINSVEALKIMLEVWGIEYEVNPNIWYKGVVDKAAEKNYIPLDTIDFGAKVRRDQMADMMARAMSDEAGEMAEYLGPRAYLKADYSTIQRAVHGDDFNFDPNDNALILTTILTSQADDEKVFTVLDVENGGAEDGSIKYIPKNFMYSDEFNTYYYTTSAICILDGSCSPSQIAKLDEILTEGWLIAESFSLGEKEPGAGCYFVSDFDFQMSFPESWGSIHDFTILDIAYWANNFGFEGAAAYTGQGVVCSGGGGDMGDNGGGNGGIIRIQGK